MKISQILKNITPEEKKKEIEKIKKIKLSKDLQKWVNKYENVCGERDGFFWKWIYRGVEETSLCTTTVKYKKNNRKCEFLFIIFVVIFDYIVDRKKNKKLLDELSKIPFANDQIELSEFDNDEKKIINLVIEIWRQIKKIVKTFPAYKEFKEIWYYDISQIMNAMKYDYIVSRNHFLINNTEYRLYAPHTMQVVVAITVGLMCSSKFNKKELGFIREVVLEIQKMARISNWINTWEREIKDNDFTSGIFAYALGLKVLAHNELKKENLENIVRKVKKADIEKKLMSDWDECYSKVLKYRKIRSINVNRLLFGERKTFILYLISKGKI